MTVVTGRRTDGVLGEQLVVGYSDDTGPPAGQVHPRNCKPRHVRQLQVQWVSYQPAFASIRGRPATADRGVCMRACQRSQTPPQHTRPLPLRLLSPSFRCPCTRDMRMDCAEIDCRSADEQDEKQGARWVPITPRPPALKRALAAMLRQQTAPAARRETPLQWCAVSACPHCSVVMTVLERCPGVAPSTRTALTSLVVPMTLQPACTATAICPAPARPHPRPRSSAPPQPRRRARTGHRWRQGRWDRAPPLVARASRRLQGRP